MKQIMIGLIALIMTLVISLINSMFGLNDVPSELILFFLLVIYLTQSHRYYGGGK